MPSSSSLVEAMIAHLFEENLEVERKIHQTFFPFILFSSNLEVNI
jgi:hypothetical protein